MNNNKKFKIAVVISFIVMVFIFIFAEKNKQPKVSEASRIEDNKKIEESKEIESKRQSEKSIFKEPELVKNASFNQLPYPITKAQYEKAGDSFLIIEKTYKTESVNLSLQDTSAKKEVILEFTGADSILIDESKLYEVFNGQYVDLKKTENSTKSPIASFEICHEIKQSGVAKTELIIQLNYSAEYQISEDEHYYYLSFWDPHQIYDKVIVLDPGHGGRDAGTYSSDETTLEKDINLDIMNRVIKCLEKEKNIKVYTTRTTDWCPSLNQRVELANDLKADLFLSIHCNANEIPDIHGVEVLYSELQDDWKTFNSKQFAQICQKSIIEKTGLHDRGIAARAKWVSVLAYAEVPAALAEVGFMSNQSDLNFLRQPEKRQLIAEALYEGIIQALEEIE